MVTTPPVLGRLDTPSLGGSRVTECPVKRAGLVCARGRHLLVLEIARTSFVAMVCKVETALPAGAEFMIIGAGIVGCSTAFSATRVGMSPVVLEAMSAPAALTTPVATGAFRLQFDNREETELVRESVDLILDFTGITGQDSQPLRVRQPEYIWATTSEDRQRAPSGCPSRPRHAVSGDGSLPLRPRLGSVPSEARSGGVGNSRGWFTPGQYVMSPAHRPLIGQAPIKGL